MANLKKIKMNFYQFYSIDPSWSTTSIHLYLLRFYIIYLKGLFLFLSILFLVVLQFRFSLNIFQLLYVMKLHVFVFLSIESLNWGLWSFISRILSYLILFNLIFFKTQGLLELLNCLDSHFWHFCFKMLECCDLGYALPHTAIYIYFSLVYHTLMVEYFSFYCSGLLSLATIILDFALFISLFWLI